MYYRSPQNLVGVSLGAGVGRAVLIGKLAAIPNSSASLPPPHRCPLDLIFHPGDSWLGGSGAGLLAILLFLFYAKLYLDQIPASGLPSLVTARIVTLHVFPKYIYGNAFLYPLTGFSRLSDESLNFSDSLLHCQVY